MGMPEINLTVVIITFIFIALDVISGLVQACVNKCVDSTKMKQGLYHKCGFVLAMCLGYVCEWSIGYIDLGFTIPIATPVCAFICLTELASILENLGKINPELAGAKFMKLFNKDGQE